jgi:hypothetical protein
MQGVPYDVLPSAPVEAEAESFWGLQQRSLSPMTMSTMRTVPELSLDVSGTKGTDARDGIYGRIVYDVGQRGQAGTDAGTATAGADAGRVVLYMSTVVGEANHSQDPAIVKKSKYRGSILVQFTKSNAASSTTTTCKTVLLVPQFQEPETRSRCPSALSCSTIDLLAVGGMGGNGGVGGNGSGGTKGGRGEVRTPNHIVADFCHFLRVHESFPFSISFFHRTRENFPTPRMVARVGTAGMAATARQGPRVERAGPLKSMSPMRIPTCSC